MPMYKISISYSSGFLKRKLYYDFIIQQVQKNTFWRKFQHKNLKLVNGLKLN